jgi:hypothetical protein
MAGPVIPTSTRMRPLLSFQAQVPYWAEPHHPKPIIATGIKRSHDPAWSC